MSTYTDWRIVPENEALDVAKDGEPVYHWAVFRSGDDWALWGTFPTEQSARDAIAKAEGQPNG